MSQSTTVSFPFAVAGPQPTQPDINNLPVPAASLGQPYSYQLQGVLGVPPYTFSASGLPAGLSITPAGLISGTPTAAGTAPLSLTITDSSTP